jgi:hypothetical protein
MANVPTGINGRSGKGQEVTNDEFWCLLAGGGCRLHGLRTG